MNRQNYINSVNLKNGTYLVLNIIDGNSCPRNPGFQVMHWHEDLQFIYVLSGAIEVMTLDKSISLRPDEAIFINKNVVHLVRKNGKNTGTIPETEKSSPGICIKQMSGELCVLYENTRMV